MILIWEVEAQGRLITGPFLPASLQSCYRTGIRLFNGAEMAPLIWQSISI
jgi:hypothetical protein